MPQYSATDDSKDSADDLYGEGGGGDEKSIDDQEKEEMMHTALVPIKVLQDSPDEEVKEGDEIVIKVKAVHGEEAEIMYAPKKKEGGEKGSMDHGDMKESADKEIDGMDNY